VESDIPLGLIDKPENADLAKKQWVLADCRDIGVASAEKDGR
jgi:hypothetical protein